MMFDPINESLLQCVELTQPIPNEELRNAERLMEGFDKDGFDLNSFEVFAYIINEVTLSFCLNRTAHQFNWFKPTTGYGLIIDHSLIAARFSYAGELRSQILDLCRINPIFTKLLDLEPKWGLDINLEYVFEDGYVMDLLHIEEDYSSLDSLLARKREMEQNLVIRTNWTEIARLIRQDKPNWQNMYGDDQNNYKAQLFGFERAYKTLKVI